MIFSFLPLLFVVDSFKSTLMGEVKYLKPQKPFPVITDKLAHGRKKKKSFAAETRAKRMFVIDPLFFAKLIAKKQQQQQQRKLLNDINSLGAKRKRPRRTPARDDLIEDDKATREKSI